MMHALLEANADPNAKDEVMQMITHIPSPSPMKIIFSERATAFICMIFGIIVLAYFLAQVRPRLWGGCQC